jgi:predicted small metal-binding protein
MSEHRIRCTRINLKTGKQCSYVAGADTAAGAEQKLNEHVRRVHGG